MKRADAGKQSATRKRRIGMRGALRPDPHWRNAAEWIDRLGLSEWQLSTFTPSKAAIPFPANSGCSG
jgi:hypothetical protein